MPDTTLQLVNKLGLHIRASSALVNLACRYLSDIQIQYQGKTANAKRIFEIMLLGAKYGDSLHITVEGQDESSALKAITNLINNRFGESE